MNTFEEDWINEFENTITFILGGETIWLNDINEDTLTMFSEEILQESSDGKIIVSWDKNGRPTAFKRKLKISDEFSEQIIAFVSEDNDLLDEVAFNFRGIEMDCNNFRNMERLIMYLPKSGRIFLKNAGNNWHPKYQRELIPVLQKNFPNVQFIISTHSPSVLYNIKKDNIFLIKNERGEITCSHPDIESFGSSVHRILKFLMQSDEFPDWKKKLLEEFSSLIIENKIEEASQYIENNLPKDFDITEPEFQKLKNLLDNKKILFGM